MVRRYVIIIGIEVDELFNIKLFLVINYFRVCDRFF